jgi:hypothetical protein
MEYRKYAWPSEGQFITDMLSAGFAQMEESESGDQINFVDCFVHQIGKVCIATDEQGNCTESDPRWAVDIIWTGDVQFESLCVWPVPGGAVHWFAGWEQNYQTAYDQHNQTTEQPEESSNQ